MIIEWMSREQLEEIYGRPSMNWDEHYFRLVHTTKEKSKDRSTKVGAIIVNEFNEQVSTGFNGFPRGIDDDNPEYHERPLKYDMTEHAERNAIYQAAAGRGGTRGCRMYLGFNPIKSICTDCARAIIQAGIVELIGPYNVQFGGKGAQWEHNCTVAYHMLKEAGIKLRTVPWIHNTNPTGTAYRALFETPANKAHLVHRKFQDD
jgi:dCMP deaminase